MTTEAFDIWYRNHYDLETRQTNPGHRAACWEAWLAASKVTEYRIADNPFSEPPVPGAVQRTITVHDVRNVDDPNKLAFREAWYEHGTNHRVIKGCIWRDMGEELAWFIEIPDIAAFVREHGSCLTWVDFFDQPWVRILALIENDD